MFTFLVCGFNFFRFSIVFRFTYFILSLRLLLIILLFLLYSALGAYVFCLHVIFFIGGKVFFAVRFDVFFRGEMVRTLVSWLRQEISLLPQEPPSYRNCQGLPWHHKGYFGGSPGGP